MAGLCTDGKPGLRMTDGCPAPERVSLVLCPSSHVGPEAGSLSGVDRREIAVWRDCVLDGWLFLVGTCLKPLQISFTVRAGEN